MMTFQFSPSLSTAKMFTSQGRSNCSERGPDTAAYPASRKFRMGGGGGPAAFRQYNLLREKYPAIHSLNESSGWKNLVSDFVVRGSANSPQEVKLELENTDPRKDLCGRQLLYDDKCTRFERTRTVIPPLTRDYPVNRPGHLHPFKLSQDLPHMHGVRPLTLGCHGRYEFKRTPEMGFPISPLVLNGRNTFSVGNCKLGRPKVNYPTYTLQTVKDNQKSQSFPDPMVGAPRSFIHRVTELSSLEGETVRQEKLKKMKKQRKAPS